MAAAASDASVLVVSSVLEADNCELRLGMRNSCCCRANAGSGCCRVENDAIITGHTANTSISIPVVFVVLIVILVRSTISVVFNFVGRRSEVKVKDAVGASDCAKNGNTYEFLSRRIRTKLSCRERNLPVLYPIFNLYVIVGE